MSRVVYGHGVRGIVCNIVLGLESWWVIYAFLGMYDWVSRSPWHMALVGWLALMFLPNATYLFFEIKHIIFKDGVADDRPLKAVLLFGGMSILGLVCAVGAIITAAHEIPFLQNNPEASLLVLSLLSAIGGCMGLNNYFSILGLAFPPYALYGLCKTLRKDYVLIAGTTVLLYVLSLAVSQFLT